MGERTIQHNSVIIILPDTGTVYTERKADTVHMTDFVVLRLIIETPPTHHGYSYSCHRWATLERRGLKRPVRKKPENSLSTHSH